MPRKRLTKSEIKDRRERVKHLVASGATTREISKMFKKEGIPSSTRTIELDRAAIREEILEEIKHNSFEKVLFEFLIKNDDIYRKANKMFLDPSTTANAKIGALNVMQRQTEAQIRILQSLGIVVEAPKKIEVSDSLTVNRARELLEELREKPEKKVKTKADYT